MKRRVIIVGKAASGKDHLREAFRREGWKIDVSVTTRERREQEKEGIHYKYISFNAFEEMVRDGKVKEYTTFQGNYYGTTSDSWESSKVFIMTPGAVSGLPEKDRKESYVVYLAISLQCRMDRLQERGWSEEEIRSRVEEDEREFKENKWCWDLSISNPLFSSLEVIRKVEREVDQ